MAKALILLGTGSDVGKSLLVAGLLRAARNRGLRVAPFKSQNMSNNAAVARGTESGCWGEIGRAQALQARAAGFEPTVMMNPVLLKPEGQGQAQVILLGKRWKSLSAREYQTEKVSLLERALDAFDELGRDKDLILVEGAGSLAETNLRENDIANLGFARAAKIPGILVADIDRGGVIAQIVGSQVLLDDQDRHQVRAFLVNKFRGDPELFAKSLDWMEKKTGWTSFGLVPWFEAARNLPAEDSMALDDAMRLCSGTSTKPLIAVLRLPSIANFDDFDPLAADPELDLRFVGLSEPLPLEASLVIIPGTKATISDLKAALIEGWDAELRAYLKRGGQILGLCGGFQMLGERLSDPEGLEGWPQEINGFGLLSISTRMEREKRLGKSDLTYIHQGKSLALSGYEIHLGQSRGEALTSPLFWKGDAPEGAHSPDGRVMGSYFHGIFSNDVFRKAFFESIGVRTSENLNFEERIESSLDALAVHLESNLDVQRLFELAE